MEIIDSNKHSLKICYNGFMYTKHVTRQTKLWWKCVKRSSGHCRGSLTTDLERENPALGQPHNHAPDETQIRLAKVRNWMKAQAANTRDKPAQIFNRGVSQCDDGLRSLIPSADICKRTLHNQRPTPPVPSLLKDLETSKLPARSEQIASRFSWTNPRTLKTPSLKQASNNEIKSSSENHGTKREASATVTSAEQQEQHPSKILRRYFEGKSRNQRESSDSVSILEPSQAPKERPAPKLSLPQTKVTFQPTTPVPPTQHRKVLVVSEHQRNVMTSLASLWKKGQLCDAGIGNGTTIVMVHKIILLAVCPKLLTMFNSSGQSNRFLQVNFPQAISHEALTAFAEYIYNGVLDLSAHLLSQLRQMALQLGMKELEMLCAAHLSPHDLASMTVKIDPGERPPSPYDSIQIVNFKTDDDISPQESQDNSTQSRPSRKKTLSSSIYQRLVISSPEVMLNKEENKYLCLSPSLDESLQGIDIPNSKFGELSNLPAADIQDSCIASLIFESSAEKPLSVSNIKTEPINIDDDSCDQAENYPHNAPTASPADVLTTNYSSLVSQLQEQRLVGSTSHTPRKRKSRSTVTRIKYSSEDEVHNSGWQDLSFKKEKDFVQPSSDKDTLDADIQPFPVELISIVRRRKLSLKSAPD